jgi:phenylpropionate dioxygenase-like ring-hydroxylating dioxygenase large terminal subunit
MDPLEHAWMSAAWSRDLKKKPLPIEILGRRFMIYRGRDGKPVAIENRCPHRGVELANGWITDGGIRCPYHGWLFDAAGRCVDIPSRSASQQADQLPDISVPALRVHESDGMVWVAFREPYQPEPEPWQFPRHRAFLVDVTIDCDYVRVMENLVDASHAAFLHAGLLRAMPKTEVAVQVDETERGVHIRTDGEKAQGSLLYRLSGGKGADVLHTEEFVEPNIVKLVYDVGSSHSSSQFVAVPVDEHRTRLFARVTARVPGFTAIAFPAVELAIRRIIKQDVAIMEDMARNERFFPGKMCTSVRADTPSIWLARAAEEFRKNGPRAGAGAESRSTTVGYKL